MWHVFAIDPVWAVMLAAVLGLAVGSWITAAGHRLPRIMERDWAQQWQAAQNTGQADGGEHEQAQEQPYTLWRPGWHCTHCHAPVRGWQRLPILSWVFTRGHCSDCGASIGWRYPVTETLTAILFALCAWQFGPTPLALAAMGFCAALLLLSWIDLQTCLLPDAVTLPLAWAGLLVNLHGAITPLPLAVLGAVAGYLFLWLLFHVFRLVTGREGMGYGDFKLLAALGAWLGLASLPMLLLVASISGVVAALCLRLIGRAQAGQALPFGPYLALAGVVMLFVTVAG
ncbi:prepilin peptidase [Bordetella sp. 02P26C-1]|uniref:prepilin peptidase n=1 Tax=Bordetella sp. 02P26C-1 TaxID=2683195 RepID=UPI001354F6CA|nr:A24 family peptidase [Bordetella sp. 02P26C-1]MVW79169.1 prepilin peptidase [Bordetella sp. 02P26C-1]